MCASSRVNRARRRAGIPAGGLRKPSLGIEPAVPLEELTLGPGREPRLDREVERGHAVELRPVPRDERELAALRGEQGAVDRLEGGRWSGGKPEPPADRLL